MRNALGTLALLSALGCKTVSPETPIAPPTPIYEEPVAPVTPREKPRTSLWTGDPQYEETFLRGGLQLTEHFMKHPLVEGEAYAFGPEREQITYLGPAQKGNKVGFSYRDSRGKTVLAYPLLLSGFVIAGMPKTGDEALDRKVEQGVMCLYARVSFDAARSEAAAMLRGERD